MIQSFKMALKSIASNKLRSFLTMLGIIIGVMALVVLVSIANGATSSVTSSISSLGSNLLTVSISDDKGEPIKQSTLTEWSDENGIGEIAPYAQASVTGKYGSTSDSVTVYGTTAAYSDIQELSIDLGRYIKTTDVENSSYVCVISKAAATELIGYSDCVGDILSFDGMKFTIVGVLEDDDSSLTSVFKSDSLVAYIPYTTLMRLSTDVSSDMTSFYVSAEEDGTVDEAETAVTELLMNRFDQDEDAFDISSQDMPDMPVGTSSDGTTGMPSGFNGERPQMNSGSGDTADAQSATSETDSGDTADAQSATSETSSGDTADAQNAIPDTSSGDTVDAQNAMPDTSSGNMPEDFDPSQMPDGFGGSGMGGQGRDNSMFGLISFIGSWWIPIGILCVLVDAFCIFMLIRISKERKPAYAAEETTAAVFTKERKPEISSYEKRRRKRRRTIRIAVILLAIVVAIVLGYVMVRSIYMAQLAKAEAVSTVSASAVDATIDTDISGTGTLTDADIEEITVPDGVEIVAYLVEDGDKVETGDILATVDHTSVMTTIAKVQNAMDSLDEDIDAASSDTIDSKITASVDGRVKVIYAKEDASVDDTMYENGSLMLISLDGLMAADIETDANIAAGDSVKVVLANGTEEDGRVDSSSGGVATITVTDDGTAYGEAVTITDENGTVLGESTLYIHSELKVTGYSGMVSAIKCDENDKVRAGKTLMTLTDTDYSAEYDLLLKQRSEYEEVMAELFKLYADENIYTELTGTVSGVDEEDTAVDEDASTEDEEDTAVDETAFETEDETSSQLNYSFKSQDVLVSQLVYTIESLDDGSAVPIPVSNNPTGVDAATAAGYSNSVSTVSSVSYNSITLLEYPSNVAITDYSNYSSLGISSEMMTTEKQISPAVTTPVYIFENGAWSLYSLGSISAGDVLILTYSQESENPVWIVVASKSQGAVSGPATSSGSMGGSSASTETEETEETEEVYTISDTTVMSVTPSDKMSVSITIDELDILSMEEGQEALITLDAISGQTFTGSVTDIDMTGANSGGSTKYTAVVTMDRTDQMLAGMNAAVSITLSSTDCAITVPVAALVESESGLSVYTSYNEEDNTLGDPVTVTTGISDGTNVEILSGLNSGDEIWYEYDDTVSISSSVSSSTGGFNLMSVFGGGGNRR